MVIKMTLRLGCLVNLAQQANPNHFIIENKNLQINKQIA